MSYQLTRDLLVECFSFDPTRLEEGGTYVEKLGGGRYRFRAKAQHCGVKNRNNRVYPIPVWEQHCTPTAAFIKRVKARRVIGHLEHPTDGKSQMGMAAVLVTEVETPNKKGEVWSVFETLSTPAGMIVASFIRDGVGFGISSRGNGSVVNKGGIDEVQEDYEPITFDMVIDESTPGAEVHARRLKESVMALMESAGGDTATAIRMDQEIAERAVANALLTEGCPPTGFSKFCLAYDDGSAHYRAYDNGLGQWDVWLHPHNLPPEQIVTNLSTAESAQEAAKQHYRMVKLSGQRDAQGEAAHALKKRRWATQMGETYSVRSSMPYSGIAVKLVFTSAPEAKTALTHVQKAGFHADLEDDTTVCIYTSIEDEAAALAHLQRLLSAKDIEMKAESTGFIYRGRPIWEDAMTLRRLDEMPYGGMEEMPYGEMHHDEVGDEPMFDAEDDEPDDDDDDDDDEDEDDEDDEENEAMYEMPMDYGYDDDDPEDIDLDVDVDESEGFVKVWYDEDDEPVELHHYDEHGILEAVTDVEGNLLLEMPTAAMRAMFAKGFARDDVKAKTQSASQARTQSPEYYRKFRGKWAKKRNNDVGAAKAGMGRFKKGRNVRGGPLKARIAKGARMSNRPVTHTSKHKSAAPGKWKRKVKKGGKRRRMAASYEFGGGNLVEQFHNEDGHLVEQYVNDGGLIETYIEGTLVEMADPETGLVLYELRGGKGSPASAMFAKTFSKKEPAVSIRKRQKNYSKLRAGYADTKYGKGMSPSKLRKGSRALPKGEKSKRRKERKKMAPVRSAMRKLRKGAAKMQAQGSRKKGAKFTAGGKLKIGNLRKGGGRKKLKASWDFDLNDLLIEDETGTLYVYDYEGDPIEVGGLDEDGDIFLWDDDGDQVWLTEDDLDEYDAEYEDGYAEYMEEMEVGAHGGGTPVALKMKGTGQAGRRGGPGPHGARHGGKHGVKAKSGQPYNMRGGGSEEQDESYGDDPYTTRLEDQIARQQEIIDAYQNLQHAEALESAKTRILGAHPELAVVESRLDRCASAEEMRVEAEALLTLVESSRGSKTWNRPINGGNGVNSGNVGGAPGAELLQEEQVITGFDAALSGVGSSDTASRVAAARRRRLNEAQN